MCIRDSIRAVQAIGQRRVNEGPLQQSMQRTACDDRIGGYPVSYTHLRAHETVLDIVCRLLLEKKKSLLCNLNM